MSRPTSHHESGYALLVGVETYEDFPEEKQLLAGRNDVLALWRVCRRLGFLPQNIRVLTSPVLTREDIFHAERRLGAVLPEYRGKTEEEIRGIVEGWSSRVALGEATMENVLAEVERLAARRAPGGGAPANRLLTYSGHGAHAGGDLMLCPKDTGSDLRNAIPFRILRRILSPVGEDLTVVLDCCFAQSASVPSGHRITSLTDEVAKESKAPDLGGRVLCASASTQPSVQTMLGGAHHGAFTWALSVALEQWKIVREGDELRSTISYGELVLRATKLLDALSFEQKPTLGDRDRVGDLPAFHHGPWDHPGETSAAPDAERRGGQLDPSARNRLFVLTATDDRGNTTHVADILATSASPPPSSDPSQPFAAKEEYYYCIADLPPSCAYLTITATDESTRFPSKPSKLKWAEVVDMGKVWTSAQPTLFVSDSSIADPFMLFWGMTTEPKATKWDGWRGDVSWSHQKTGLLFTGLSAGEINFTLRPDLPPYPGQYTATAHWYADGTTWYEDR